MKKARSFLAILVSLMMLAGCVFSMTGSAFADDAVPPEEVAEGQASGEGNVTEEVPPETPTVPEEPEVPAVVEEPVPTVEEQVTPPTVEETVPEVVEQETPAAEPDTPATEPEAPAADAVPSTKTAEEVPSTPPVTEEDTSDASTTPSQDEQPAAGTNDDNPADPTDDPSEEENNDDEMEAGSQGGGQQPVDNVPSLEDAEGAGEEEEQLSDEAPAEEGVVPAADAEGAEDEEEDVTEPAELKVGEELKGTVKVDEPFLISLKSEKAGKVLLTLTADTQLKVSADEKELTFTADIEADPSGKTLTAEMQVTAGTTDIALNASEDTEFTLSAALIESVDPAADAEEDAEGAEDEEEDVTEPAELKVGEELKGTVKADEAFLISLKTEKAGKVLLTLTADTQLKVSADEKELTFTADTEADPSGKTSTAEIEVQSGTTDLVLTASSDADFTLKTKAAEKEELPEEEEETDQEGEEEEEPEGPAESEGEGEEAFSEEDGEEEAAREPSVSYDVYFENGVPMMGGTAQFVARIEGFENMDYEIVWQTSPDDVEWTDLDEHGETMDVVITEDNCLLYWRVVVRFQETQEQETQEPEIEETQDQETQEPETQDQVIEEAAEE